MWKAIAFGIFCLLAASDIYTPSMPDISLYFGVSSNAVQATITFYFIGTIIASFICGFMADSLGQKRLLLWGSLTALIGSLLCMGAFSNEMLIVGRLIQGLGAAILPVVGFAVIQHHYPIKEVVKIFSIMGMTLCISPAIAPALGGWINTYFNWRVNFGLIAVLLLISYMWLRAVVPADPSSPTKFTLKTVLKNYGQILKHRQFLGLALTIPLFYGAQWFYLSFLPFYTHEVLGVSSELYGMAIGLLPVPGFFIGSFCSRYLPKYIGVNKTMYLGISCGIAASGVLLFLYAFSWVSLWTICGALGLFLFGLSLLFPTTVPICLEYFKSIKSTASSVRSGLVILGGGIGAYFAEISSDTNFLVMGGFMLVSTILALLFLKVGLIPNKIESLEQES